MTHIKPYTYVVFDKSTVSPDIYEQYYKDKFEGKLLVFLGEVTNAQGHCILTDLNDGRIIGLHHTDNFRIATEDEI